MTTPFGNFQLVFHPLTIRSLVLLPDVWRAGDGIGDDWEGLFILFPFSTFIYIFFIIFNFSLIFPHTIFAFNSTWWTQTEATLLPLPVIQNLSIINVQPHHIHIMQTEQLCFPYADVYAAERNETERVPIQCQLFIPEPAAWRGTQNQTHQQLPSNRPAAIWFAISAMALNSIDSSLHIICVGFASYLFHRIIYGTVEVSWLGVDAGGYFVYRCSKWH